MRKIHTAALICFLAASLTLAKEYDFQRYYSKKWYIKPGDIVVLENPVGEIHITNTPKELGSFVMVKQRIYAAFDELAKSRQMVMMVRLDVSRRPDSLLMFTKFPMHMFEKYRYPDMGGFFTPQVEGVWQGRKMVVSPKRGAKLWSDIYIQVPAGQKLIVKSIATTLIIEDFIGDIDFATDHASAMTVGDIQGNLFLTACHGALSVSKFQGDLFYDGEDSDISFCDVVKGSVQAKSTTGDIIWNAKCDSTTLVEIESLSGKIMFNGEVADITRLKNDDGDIEIEPTSVITDSLIAQTNGGDIEINLPENFAHKIIARSANGKVKHSFPTGSDRYVEGELKGRAGIVFLSSQRGSIKIKLKSTK